MAVVEGHRRQQFREMAQVNAPLYITVSSWLRKHGKTVKPMVTAEQKHEFQQCFRLMDGDGSGAIDVQELSSAFRLLGIRLTNKEVKELVEAVDRDHTGDVGWDEFLEIMMETLSKLADDPQAGDRSYQLPFGLMATMYRRKRYMDSLLAGTKEGFSAMVRIAEQLQQQQDSHGRKSHGGSPPRSPRRSSVKRNSTITSRPPGTCHQPGASSGQLLTMHPPSAQRPGSPPSSQDTAPASPITPVLRPKSAASLQLSARHARLHDLYQGWVQQGQERRRGKRRGGGGMKAVSDDGLFGRGASATTNKLLLQMPQANLPLTFSRPIVSVPRTVPTLAAAPAAAVAPPRQRPASALPYQSLAAGLPYNRPISAPSHRPASASGGGCSGLAADTISAPPAFTATGCALAGASLSSTASRNAVHTPSASFPASSTVPASSSSLCATTQADLSCSTASPVPGQAQDWQGVTQQSVDESQQSRRQLAESLARHVSRGAGMGQLGVQVKRLAAARPASAHPSVPRPGSAHPAILGSRQCRQGAAEVLVPSLSVQRLQPETSVGVSARERAWAFADRL